MKIWHVGAAPSPQKVCGVNQTVWLIARSQAQLGHKVGILLAATPNDRARELARQDGIDLIQLSANAWRYAPEALEPQLEKNPPQVVHLHSVFIPKQATLAQTLVRYGIPYAITPHGGLNFRRSPLKKILYSALLEKTRFARSAAITTLVPQEEAAVRSFVPNYSGIVRWMPNPVDIQKFQETLWKQKVEAKQIVYLGRFDVLHKGLDLLVEIARRLPEFSFHLYGTKDPKTRRCLERLQRDLPANVHFHKPVFGEQKTQVMANASLYIQMSRWEGFPISIAEAMYLGVPCALSAHLGVSELFRDGEIGLSLSIDPQAAASQLWELFRHPQPFRHWSERSRAFACQHFHPHTVASAYLDLYQQIANPNHP